MAEHLVWSGSGVTEFALSTAYSVGDRVVMRRLSTGTNHAVAKRYVWECTTAWTTAAADPTYSASYTPDVSTITSNTAVFTCRNPGYSSGATKDWAFATIYLQYGIYRAQTAGDVVKVHKTHLETWSISQNMDLVPAAVSIGIYCVDKDASDALSVMDETLYGIQHTITNYGIWWKPTAGAKYFTYGLAFKSGDTGNGWLYLGGASAVEYHDEFELCHFWTNGATGGGINVGSQSASLVSQYQRFRDCTFKFRIIGGYFQLGQDNIDFIGCDIDQTGAAPTTLFQTYDTGRRKTFDGCDFSWAGATLMADGSPKQSLWFTNCKLSPSITAFYTVPASASFQSMAGAELGLINCSSGDTHYNFAYYNPLGSIEAVTSIYADDGALYDGTNHVTWQITTTAYATFERPFVTPWIEKYHSGVAAITPFLEVLRDGSTTAYQDDEVWGEFSYQGTNGYPLSTAVQDRMALLGTPANQAAGAATWTGGTTPWSGKLAPAASITPAEIGMLRARVNVGAASITVYVDPKIRT